MTSLEKKYIEDKIKSARNRFKRNVEDLFNKCIKWPIILLVLGLLLWGVDYILSNFPIIKHIYKGFRVNILCSGLMFLLLIIAGIWASIGIPNYIVKLKKFEKNLEREIKKIKSTSISAEDLHYFEIIEDGREEAVRNMIKQMEAEKKGNKYSSNASGNRYFSENNFSYENEMKEYNQKNFCFVDASGSYRYWGDDFVDTKGNWCRWGTGFYDYAGNYIRWGNTFQDSSGVYRHWGDDFIDGAGNWVKCNF